MAIIKKYPKSKNYQYITHCSGTTGCPHVYKHKNGKGYLIWNPDNGEEIHFTNEEFAYLKKRINDNII